MNSMSTIAIAYKSLLYTVFDSNDVNLVKFLVDNGASVDARGTVAKHNYTVGVTRRDCSTLNINQSAAPQKLWCCFYYVFYNFSCHN